MDNDLANGCDGLMEFKAFPKIPRLGKMPMSITQKIHGTNAQVLVTKMPDGTFNVRAGSRTRWLTVNNDNYGFAGFVAAHEQSIAELLGPGRHYGEWAGPGINSGEGLTERQFILFDHWKYPEGRPLPPKVRTVPVLYCGGIDFTQITAADERLLKSGSLLVPGFMRPEGFVVSIGTTRMKYVFEPEETAWNEPGPKAFKSDKIDYSAFLQPIRLEKLLSRDETFLRNYPKSLPNIVTAYIADLVSDGPVRGTDAGAILPQSEVFRFVKSCIESLTRRVVRDNFMEFADYCQDKL